jgi:hypothetical protein
MRTLLLSHRENEKCGFKKYIKVMSKKKFQFKSNEESISEVHWNFPNIYFFNFKWCDCYKFYPWESISH